MPTLVGSGFSPRFGLRFEVSEDALDAIRCRTGFNSEYRDRVNLTITEMQDTYTSSNEDGVTATLGYDPNQERCELTLADSFGHSGKILKNHVMTLRDQTGDQIRYFADVLEALVPAFAEDKTVIIPGTSAVPANLRSAPGIVRLAALPIPGRADLQERSAA